VISVLVSTSIHFHSLLNVIFLLSIKDESLTNASAAIALFVSKLATCHAGKYLHILFIAAPHHSNNHQ
jgi:hypothetical protein